MFRATPPNQTPGLDKKINIVVAVILVGKYGRANRGSVLIKQYRF